ncbi:MAG: hypothetical protein K2H20_04810 [Bacilli bacterium]|nr:hypothetical protein [Bacilli bacterium]
MSNSQIDRMKSLINYGNKVNENTNTGMLTPRVEYSTLGADGKTYGIIRECNKFYIKVAPKKDTQVVAEDFDYIGGFMNKKQHEYATYSIASKQFDLKMMSINEACDVKNRVVSQYKEETQSDWQINETKEMRNELNRFNQICNNVNYILAEDKKGFTLNNSKVPEAPASHPSTKAVNAPFTDTAVAKGDKDFTEKETNPQKAGAPFNEDGKATDKDMQSDKNPKGNDGKTYSEKAKYVPDNAVADKNPSGAKAVKMNESKRRVVKLTEEQVYAWNHSKDYIDKSKGTEIGSSAPFTDEVGCESNQCEADTEKIHEDAAVHNTDNQNVPAPHTGEVGDKAPFDETVNEEVVDVDDVEGMETIEDDVPFPEVEDGGSYLDFEKDYNDFEENGGFDEIDGDAHDAAMADMDDEFELDGNFNGFDDDYNDFYESITHKVMESVKRTLSEEKLDDFGKHPAYQKTPMTTPPNKEVAKNGAKDWNDKSVESDAPFGSKIGSGAPFDEKVINLIADAVMSKMGFSKKA